MHAVGFALTGKDNADPIIDNLANCVFPINDEVFRLNNVYRA
jgi:hypothetical protein